MKRQPQQRPAPIQPTRRPADTLISLFLTLIAVSLPGRAMAAEAATASRTVVPRESTEAVLHNPGMGWVLYENYPLDQDPSGSSTLLLLPNDDFPGVDVVAIMFSWQDIEREPDRYDFSKVDFAYDYWSKRGKEIQLRVSATSLLWWLKRQPPAGTGAPDYVLAKLAPSEKQTRHIEGLDYIVEDSRNTYYRERLSKFLRALDAHFDKSRPVTLIDLRGFGLWGEWHSGFQYTSVDVRRAALTGIIDTWCDALPNRRLALSYSYDPDSPKELYAGSTNKFDEQFTAHYDDYLKYSAFDYALTKPNITFRRDGAGGAVHSNERKLCEEAFQLGRGPMFCEFVDGYASSKKGGPEWVKWRIDDALSLHPNYICLLGYQGGDTLDFLRERSDLFEFALRRMGYRLVPTRAVYPQEIRAGPPFDLQVDWVNRAVGRAPRDFELELLLLDNDKPIATANCGTIETARWIAGESYPVRLQAKFDATPPGEHQLAFRLRDPLTNRAIAIPLTDRGPNESYILGKITVAQK